jgi:hypothetical protein
LIKVGDVLLLQETPGEALARYVKDVFSFTIISNVIDRSSTTGTAMVRLPGG